MIVSRARSLRHSDPHTANLRRRFTRLIAPCAALALSGGAFGAELKFTTDDSLKIEGFQKATGKCPGNWQSAEMLLSVIGRGDLPDAVGTSKANSTMLRLDRGWAYVRVLCDGPEVRRDAEEQAGSPEDLEDVAPDKGTVLPGWVFALAHKTGAGAEGTDFIAELDGDAAHFYADADNTSAVLLAVSCPALGQPDRTKDVQLSPGQFARVEPDAAKVDHHKVNGVSCCTLTSGDVLADAPVPAGKQAFHAAALAEAAANGF